MNLLPAKYTFFGDASSMTVFFFFFATPRKYKNVFQIRSIQNWNTARPRLYHTILYTGLIEGCCGWVGALATTAHWILNFCDSDRWRATDHFNQIVYFPNQWFPNFFSHGALFRSVFSRKATINISVLIIIRSEHSLGTAGPPLATEIL